MGGGDSAIAFFGHVQFVAQVEALEVFDADILEAELVQDGNAVVEAALFLGLDIFGEGLAGLVGIRRVGVVSGIAREETQGGEKEYLRLGFFFANLADAIVDASALRVQTGSVVAVRRAVVLPTSAFFAAGEVVGRGPEHINVVHAGCVDLPLERVALGTGEAGPADPVGRDLGVQCVRPKLLGGVGLRLDRQ